MKHQFLFMKLEICEESIFLHEEDFNTVSDQRVIIEKLIREDDDAFLHHLNMIDSPINSYRLSQGDQVKVVKSQTTLQYMKNFIVIGGTSGIGLETARKIRDGGHNVIVGSRNRHDLDHGLKWFEIDVTEEFKVPDDLPDEVHGLVYCPGTILLKPFRGLKDKDFRNDLEVNFLGGVKVIRSLLKNLKKADPGSSIVMFSTVAVQKGMTFHSSVAASKGAVEGLVRSLSAELSPRIRINAVAPSIINTPMSSKILRNEDAVKRSADRHPMKRIGSTEDIASMVEFLMSDEASWITGQIIHVDGGLSSV